MHPFTGLATREDGAIKVCCRSQPIGWIQNESLESAWNNDRMLRIRQQVLNDEIPAECIPCLTYSPCAQVFNLLFSFHS